MVLKVKVTNMGEKETILETDKQEKILIPNNYIPSNAEVGSCLYVTINLKEEIGKDNEELAKEMLNELIGGGTKE